MRSLVFLLATAVVLATAAKLTNKITDPVTKDAEAASASPSRDAGGPNTRFLGIGGSLAPHPGTGFGVVGGHSLAPHHGAGLGVVGGHSFGGLGVSHGVGVNPIFGGFNGGFGGSNTGFGGVNTGFGVNPVRPVVGVNPGFGGIASGIGGVSPIVGGVSPVVGGVSPLGGSVAPPSSCRYWCRTPQGQGYCCENVNEPQSFATVVKPGQCPPVRLTCPPVRSFGPPASCSNDGACGGVDKCCYDICLEQHTCKAPLGLGR